MSAGLFLIARVAGRAVAFSAGQVDSAVDLGVITPAPLAAAGVVGLAALRSRVVTVIDPRIVLGLATSETLTQRAVVTRIDGHLYAILVETLEDVADYRTAPLPSGVALGGWAAAGTGLIERAGEPVLVVDLDRLIPHPATVSAAAAA